MVKLQKHKAYTYTSESGEDIEHYKHTVTIPEDVMRQLGWQSGIDLEPEVKDSVLTLKPVRTEEKVFDTGEPRLLTTLKNITNTKEKAKRTQHREE